VRHPVLKAHTRQQLPTQRLLSIYYDTPDLTLHKSKTAVRLRKLAALDTNGEDRRAGFVGAP
jgi:inorganic triphosphatase YgiF